MEWQFVVNSKYRHQRHRLFLGDFGTDLIAGGLFTSAAGVPARSIAKWNGTSWDSLGSGMGATSVGYDYVFGLAEYNNKLFAGGMFLTAGSVIANGIASWNGSTWADLQGGVWYGSSNAYGVNAVCVYNGSLYAGGLFSSAGSIGASHIARWTEPAVGINDADFENLLLYPNPVNSVLTIKGTKQGGIIRILDIYGNCIATKKSNELITEIDMQKNIAGVYFLTYIIGNTQKTMKLINY